MTPRKRRFILQIVPFGVLWFVFGLIHALIEKGILGDSTHYPSTRNPYDFSSGIVLSLVLTTCTGLMIGIFEVRYLNRLFARLSFGMKIASTALVYLTVITVFLIVVATLNNAQKLDTNLSDSVVWETTWNFVSGFAFWSVALFIAVLMVIAVFYSDISDNIGQSQKNASSCSWT